MSDIVVVVFVVVVVSGVGGGFVVRSLFVVCSLFFGGER